MLKFVIMALLLALVVYLVFLRRPPPPPRDWRRGGDDGGPLPPTVHISLDTGRKPANDTAPGDKPQPAMTDSGSDGGGGD